METIEVQKFPLMGSNMQYDMVNIRLFHLIQYFIVFAFLKFANLNLKLRFETGKCSISEYKEFYRTTTAAQTRYDFRKSSESSHRPSLS